MVFIVLKSSPPVSVIHLPLTFPFFISSVRKICTYTRVHVAEWMMVNILQYAHAYHVMYKSYILCVCQCMLQFYSYIMYIVCEDSTYVHVCT